MAERTDRDPVEQDPSVHRALGLTDDEADEIARILGRPANHLELAMYSVMWSEHCSYKSSRVHLRRLPSEAPHVLVGPGEGAGVVDVGDGIAAAFRIESHNHPSAIEPYQGAATGVGGILRDVFSMGARPIALMDPLRFGPLDDPRSRWIAEGVVSGVSGYGNSVGVPTVGGETIFDATYQGNPLVNVFCLGVLPQDRLALARASGPGNLTVLFGSATGRDGIGGASVLASASFTDGDADESASKRPSVQVGDPFEEKRLIEACLEILEAGLVVGIQDLGAAGITGAASETASKGGVGMDLYLDQVHVREEGMDPFEIMISESQERMLAIVEPAKLDELLAICAKWEIAASVIGTVTGTGRFRVLDRLDGELLADIPASSLDDDAPLYQRPLAEPADRAERAADTAESLPAPADAGADLLALLADTSWVWSQYDHQLFLNTVVGPGDDATVLRLKDPRTGEPTGRGLGLTTDGNHRWCRLDPRTGMAAVVAESVMNLACVGAEPLALVNCLNFGNPEHPEVMWQLSEAIDGMAEACRALSVPVIGGNVSLYNESNGVNIDPSPVIGTVGLIASLERRPPGMGLVEGTTLVVLGAPATTLSGSAWAWSQGHREGMPPQVDLDGVRATAAFVRDAVAADRLRSVHDLAGGLGPALAEMAVDTQVGARVELPAPGGHVALFAETPAAVLAAVDPGSLDALLADAGAAGVPAEVIGEAGGDRLVVGDLVDVSVGEAHVAWRDRLPSALGAGTTQG
ncbi:phosphoribosylformylglycinamidine synthase subunit PurL [Acidimicrobiia bacterium EGI L10123]|uniref:phosphoribosylformylglycinamidine synthase subunit PurL n=1 Tax=Salinilacustrithrix flava TaxID=2957203 RepID=UPI003D7C2B01|nr:phosphoribosylformylglycinamidine synthase subunit PurL [Acidimicrobiia bacterium EGI L10123]